MSSPHRGTFRSLRGFNYRTWAIGSLLSNIGTWMQRVAQDWLVLTQLTQHDAAAVGVVTSLQFAPQVLLLPLTGFAADHLDRRKLLMVTQASMGALALGLGLLSVGGVVRLWEVYVFAGLLGCVTAFDSPARHAFISELVGEADLSNAVALNSTSFNGARMVGPAVAGVVIAAVGSGWAFMINAASFGAVLVSLGFIRVTEIHAGAHTEHAPGRLLDGFLYFWRRPDLRTILAMLFLIGTFGLSFPIYISTMSVIVFHAGADQYGLLTSMMAVGSVAGALLSARRERPRIGLLFAGSLVFGIGFALAAVMPSFWLFGATLVMIGVSAQTFTTTAISAVQLSTEPAMRGRVMAIVLAVALGGLALGAPFVGWIANRFGPRAGLGVAAAAGFAAALVGVYYLTRYPELTPVGAVREADITDILENE